MICPKCAYQRTTEETSPEWQCPQCGIAYHKYQAYLSGLKAVTVPRASSEGAAVPYKDGSNWSLVLTNLVALFSAWIFDWQVIDLVMVYWLQTQIIGSFFILRVLLLKRFSTEGIRGGAALLGPSALKLYMTFCFAVVFFPLHQFYADFVSERFAPLGFTADMWPVVLFFLLNHGYSFLYHLELDTRGAPKLERLISAPMVRVIPLHLWIAITLVAGVQSLIVFVLLKTLADLGAHHVEHRMVQVVGVRT